MLPREFLALDRKSKAFVTACIDLYVEHEKKEAEKLEREAK